MSDQETQTLRALAWMVAQYCTDENGILDNLAMSAGELAMEVLAKRGFVKLENPRIGAWTLAGRIFLDSN